MTREELIAWLELHPLITPRSLSVAAGLDPTHVQKIIDGRKLTELTAIKLLVVLKRYGYSEKTP